MRSQIFTSQLTNESTLTAHISRVYPKTEQSTDLCGLQIRVHTGQVSNQVEHHSNTDSAQNQIRRIFH